LIVLACFRDIFLVDAIYLIVYSSKKPSALTDDEREAIQAQAREEARKELRSRDEGSTKARRR
jgi:hypothetical protein